MFLKNKDHKKLVHVKECAIGLMFLYGLIQNGSLLSCHTIKNLNEILNLNGNVLSYFRHHI